MLKYNSYSRCIHISLNFITRLLMLFFKIIFFKLQKLLFCRMQYAYLFCTVCKPTEVMRISKHLSGSWYRQDGETPCPRTIPASPPLSLGGGRGRSRRRRINRIGRSGRMKRNTNQNFSWIKVTESI